MKAIFFLCLVSVSFTAQAAAQTTLNAKQQALWEKLGSTIREADHNLDGVLDSKPNSAEHASPRNLSGSTARLERQMPSCQWVCRNCKS